MHWSTTQFNDQICILFLCSFEVFFRQNRCENHHQFVIVHLLNFEVINWFLRVDTPFEMNQPKLIWGCKGRGIELIGEVFMAKKWEITALSADYFAKISLFNCQDTSKRVFDQYKIGGKMVAIPPSIVISIPGSHGIPFIPSSIFNHIDPFKNLLLIKIKAGLLII